MTARQQLQAIIAALELASGKKPSRAAALKALWQVMRVAVGKDRASNLPKTAKQVLSVLQGGSLGADILSGNPGNLPPSRVTPGTPPAVPPGTIAAQSPPPSGGRRPTYQPQGYPEEQGNFSDEFLSPSSSNVYSFQYYRRPRDRTGILYVTFKATGLNRDALHTGQPRFRGGRGQLHGEVGKTVTGMKQNKPGPTYAYFSVPPAVFARMKQAYSKGKFVWDELRVRGTLYGHRYSYKLVVGQLIEGIPGSTVGQYIPRKATRRGYVTRSLSDIGTGRRSFVSSTLPPQTFTPPSGNGFSTRRR